jgi:hypothetical protein
VLLSHLKAQVSVLFRFLVPLSHLMAQVSVLFHFLVPLLRSKEQVSVLFHFLVLSSSSLEPQCQCQALLLRCLAPLSRYQVLMSSCL